MSSRWAVCRVDRERQACWIGIWRYILMIPLEVIVAMTIFFNSQLRALYAFCLQWFTPTADLLEQNNMYMLMICITIYYGLMQRAS